VNNDLNNAKIAAVVTYNDLIPAFRALLRAVNGQLPEFYALAANIGRQPLERRQRCLAELAQQSGDAMQDCPSKASP
jgi:predicted aminopeptidase